MAFLKKVAPRLEYLRLSRSAPEEFDEAGVETLTDIAFPALQSLNIDLHYTPSPFLRQLPFINFPDLRALSLDNGLIYASDLSEIDSNPVPDNREFISTILPAANISRLVCDNGTWLSIPFIFKQYPTLKWLSLSTAVKIPAFDGIFPSLVEVGLYRLSVLHESGIGAQWNREDFDRMLTIFGNRTIFPSLRVVRFESLPPPGEESSPAFCEWWCNTLRFLNDREISLHFWMGPGAGYGNYYGIGKVGGEGSVLT